MCTARSGRPRKADPKPETAISKLAESAPPLKATTSPVAPAGTCASRTAPRQAAEKVMWEALVSRFGSLRVPERAESAQASLPRVEQLSDRLISQFGQMLQHALLDDLRHALRIAMRAPVRLLQDLVDQTQLLEAVRRAAHGIGGDFFLFGALPQDGGAALRRDDRIRAELQHDQPVADTDGQS